MNRHSWMKRRRVSQLSGGNNEMLGLTGFTAELNCGGLLPPKAVHRSLKLLTEEVMPAFK